MPLMTWRLGDWLGLHKIGIRHRRRPLSRRVAAERLEPRALLAGNAIVSGLTFIDANGSGDTGQIPSDEGEIVVRGVVVMLSNAGNTFSETVTTDANGEFKFFRVPAGTYTLTAQPGAQLTGSAVTVPNVIVGDSGEVNENIAMGELKPTVVSLRQFLNTSTTETLPFATAGSGRNGNATPTVLGTASSEVAFTTSASPTAKNVDLAGVFTDLDFENSEVQFQTSAGNINVELYDKDTPITVANFYEYVDSNRYDNTIFHRLAITPAAGDIPAKPFVLQGGGFSFNDTANTFPSVSIDPTIQNEFSATRSNLASTIAMAKLGGDPNSASSQFFFNLGNNAANLDNQNGGFTVFGKIVGATSTTTVTDSTLNDLIDAADPTNTAVSNQSGTNSAFNEIPLDNYSGSGFPTNDATNGNLLRIEDIVTVRRNEILSYSVVSVTAVTPTTTSPVTAAIVNHRLVVTPVPNASGVADIVVRATDLSGESVTTTIRARVVPAGNVAPTATVVLNPAQPLVNSTLTATATRADGNSSDTVNLTYVWKVGSTVVKTTSATSSLTDTLDLTTISTEVAGNIITVEVTPNDGFVNGTTVTATRTLAASNSAPTATVGLSPESPLVNSTLTATATATDVNGQPVELTYVWKVGTTTVKTTSDTTSLTDTLDLSTIDTEVAGNTITVEVTPNDGTADGTKVTATKTLSASNSAPTATVALTPASPTVNSMLTATATAADVNGQPVNLTYVWKVGSTTVKTTSATSSLTDTLDLATVTVSKGDPVSVEVTPNDGTVNGAVVTDSEVVVNSAPTATASLSPEQPLVNSIITATATKSDVDNDSVLLTYVWKVGTTTVKTTNATSSLTDTLDLSTITGDVKGQTVTVEITPNDGTANGTAAADSVVLVNSAPIATASLSPEQPLVNSTMTATATKSDANNDPVLLTYVWKVGTTTVKTTSATSSLTDTLDLNTVTEDVAGEVVTVEVTPNDGTVGGTTVTATRTLAASNSAPTATVNLTPSNPGVNSLLTATATAADVNGNPVTLTYVWKVGTNIVKTTSATSSLTNTLDLATETTVNLGDVVSVEVTPFDGTTDGSTVTDSETIV